MGGEMSFPSAEMMLWEGEISPVVQGEVAEVWKPDLFHGPLLDPWRSLGTLHSLQGAEDMCEPIWSSQSNVPLLKDSASFDDVQQQQDALRAQRGHCYLLCVQLNKKLL